MAKKSFLLYLDQDYLVDMLKEEEAGILFRDLFTYGKGHTVPDYGDNRAMAMAFHTFKATMDRDAEKYEDILRAIAGSRTTTFRKTRDTRKNSFHNFEQRDYDYEALEKALIKKQRETSIDQKQGGVYDQRRKIGEGEIKTGEKHGEAGAVCHADQSFREEAAGRKQKETETTGCPQ